jgi:hypothetical protein
MMVMPAEAFVGLTDEDLGRIIASESAGSGCLFPKIIRAAIANGRGARGKEA